MMLNLKEYDALTDSFELGCVFLKIGEKESRQILKIKGNSPKENKMDFIIFYTKLLKYFDYNIELANFWLDLEINELEDYPRNLIHKDLKKLIDLMIKKQHNLNQETISRSEWNAKTEK